MTTVPAPAHNHAHDATDRTSWWVHLAIAAIATREGIQSWRGDACSAGCC
jgi:hypothetical protein